MTLRTADGECLARLVPARPGSQSRLGSGSVSPELRRLTTLGPVSGLREMVQTTQSCT